MPEYTTPRIVSSITGIVGSDPEVRTPAFGKIVTLRLAVTTGYGDGSDSTTWYDVVIKNEGLQQSVLREVYKGARIAAQGNVAEKEYQGKPQYSMWADRIGLVQWLTRAQVAAPAAAAGPDDATAEELGF